MPKLYKHFALSCSALLFAFLLSTPSFAMEAIGVKPAKQSLGFSAGWVSGSGLTYRRLIGNHFVQGTLFSIVSNSDDTVYTNVALSAGSYLHKLGPRGIIPPLGLKIMAGADFVIDRNGNELENDGRPNQDMSYYGAGVGLDIGNPGSAGLSIWFAMNYVLSYEAISSPSFKEFGLLPSSGILYSW